MSSGPLAVMVPSPQVYLNWRAEFFIFTFFLQWNNFEPFECNLFLGYAYVIFDHEKQVKNLLSHCTFDYSSGGGWYYNMSSGKTKNKDVQVIPWQLSDAKYIKYVSCNQTLIPQAQPS